MKRHNARVNFRRSLTAIFALAAVLSAAASFASPIHPGERLTLARVIRITLRHHPRKLQAEALASAARERVGEARSKLLPQVYNSTQYLGATDNGIGSTVFLNPGFIPRIPGHEDQPRTQSFSPRNNYLAGITAYQYLFDFGRVRGEIDQSKDNAAAASARLALTDLNLIFEATQRYFALLAAEQFVNVYREAIVQRHEQLHAAQVEAKAELRPQFDVYTAQAELARARVDLINSQNAVADAKVALDNAMGLGPDAPDYQLAGVLAYQKITGSVPQYFQTALAKRPEMKMLIDEARAAGAQIVQDRSDFFPHADIAAGYDAIGTGTPASNNYQVGLIITWPIFNGFLTTHQEAEARFRRQAIRDGIRDLKQRIYLQVKSAFLNWRTSLKRIQQAKKALTASEAERELAQKRYDAGLGNIIELTEAERSYIHGRADYVNALYQFALAKAALRQATGQLLSERQMAHQ